MVSSPARVPRPESNARFSPAWQLLFGGRVLPHQAGESDHQIVFERAYVAKCRTFGGNLRGVGPMRALILGVFNRYAPQIQKFRIVTSQHPRYRPAHRSFRMVSECIILWKNTGNGAVGVIAHNDLGDPEVFASEATAEVFAQQSKLLRAFPYQIVPLDF